MAEEVLGTGVPGISFQAAQGSWWRRTGKHGLKLPAEKVLAPMKLSRELVSAENAELTAPIVQRARYGKLFYAYCKAPYKGCRWR
jgi:hypothetical protein